MESKAVQNCYKTQHQTPSLDSHSINVGLCSNSGPKIAAKSTAGLPTAPGRNKRAENEQAFRIVQEQDRHNQEVAWEIAESLRLAAEGYQRCQPDWGKRSLDRYRDGVTSCSKAATNFNIKHLLSIAIP